MKVYCIECNSPIQVNTSNISEAYIPPDLCTCDNCNQKKDDPDLKTWKGYFAVPLISYKELREKEQEEINRHRWFMSEKIGWDVGRNDSEADWRKKYEQDFLEQWHYR